jgi:hypothetical protein
MKYGDFHVSTKCGLWNAKDADGVRRLIEKSITRLNVPKITFYMLWCIKSLDEYRQMIAKGGIYDGILKAKEEGLIEHICCSTHAKGDEIVEIIADGRIEGVMLGYNAINFAYRRVGIEACYENNIGVVVMNPLSGGVIPQNPEQFSFLCENTSDTLPVAALKFLVAHKEISAALPGFSTSAELNEALLAVTDLPTVDNAYLNNLSRKLNKEMDTLCTGCAYCDECPVGIEIPKLLDCYNNAVLSGNMKRTMDKLKYHWGISPETAAKCVDCGKCEQLCTQNLPIVDRLKKICEYRA